VLPRVAACCCVLQCVAVCCSELQQKMRTLPHHQLHLWHTRIRVFQCVAVRCSVLQRDAVYCSVLQCVAVCCSVLQCVAAEYEDNTSSSAALMAHKDLCAQV